MNIQTISPYTCYTCVAKRAKDIWIQKDVCLLNVVDFLILVGPFECRCLREKKNYYSIRWSRTKSAIFFVIQTNVCAFGIFSIPHCTLSTPIPTPTPTILKMNTIFNIHIDSGKKNEKKTIASNELLRWTWAHSQTSEREMKWVSTSAPHSDEKTNS